MSTHQSELPDAKTPSLRLGVLQLCCILSHHPSRKGPTCARRSRRIPRVLPEGRLPAVPRPPAVPHLPPAAPRPRVGRRRPKPARPHGQPPSLWRPNRGPRTSSRPGSPAHGACCCSRRRNGRRSPLRSRAPDRSTCATSSPWRPSALWRQRSAGSCLDRKSIRLNSSHSQISYAVFCLKKKKKKKRIDFIKKKKKKKKKKNKIK